MNNAHRSPVDAIDIGLERFKALSALLTCADGYVELETIRLGLGDIFSETISSIEAATRQLDKERMAHFARGKEVIAMQELTTAELNIIIEQCQTSFTELALKTAAAVAELERRDS